MKRERYLQILNYLSLREVPSINTKSQERDGELFEKEKKNNDHNDLPYICINNNFNITMIIEQN